VWQLNSRQNDLENRLKVIESKLAQQEEKGHLKQEKKQQLQQQTQQRKQLQTQLEQFQSTLEKETGVYEILVNLLKELHKIIQKKIEPVIQKVIESHQASIGKILTNKPNSKMTIALKGKGVSTANLQEEKTQSLLRRIATCRLIEASTDLEKQAENKLFQQRQDKYPKAVEKIKQQFTEEQAFRDAYEMLVQFSGEENIGSWVDAMLPDDLKFLEELVTTNNEARKACQSLLQEAHAEFESTFGSQLQEHNCRNANELSSEIATSAGGVQSALEGAARVQTTFGTSLDSLDETSEIAPAPTPAAASIPQAPVQPETPSAAEP